jgi:hypothetical protein
MCAAIKLLAHFFALMVQKNEKIKSKMEEKRSNALEVATEKNEKRET